MVHIILSLLAGVGIFLFGLFLLEEAIGNLSGRKFNSFIRKYTSGRIKSVLTGIFATAVLQSSSAVSLMLLAFTGAGIISTQSAIGVILGSNLGTTFNSWIIATVGFKVNIEAFAFPFAGLGGLGLIFFGKSPMLSNISRFFSGFGFLFIGLSYMKESMEFFAQTLDLAFMAGYPLPLFILAGLILTLVIQSSLASMAIILSLLHTGVFGFEQAATMVIGINLGTTVTVLIGASGSDPLKKRVAASHFLFNFITGIAAFILLKIFIWIIIDFMGITEGVLALALFHTFFNLMGVIMFLPFIGQLGKTALRMFPDKKTSASLYISRLSPVIPEAGLEAIKTETLHLLRLVMLHNLKVFKLTDPRVPFPPKEIPGKNIQREELYKQLKLIQAEIFSFSAQLQQSEVLQQEARYMNSMLNSARGGVQSAKLLKDVQHEFVTLYNSNIGIMNQVHDDFRQKMQRLYTELVELPSETDTRKIMAVLLKWNKLIDEEDRKFLMDFTGMVRNQLLDPSYISTLLSANRGYVLSSRQLIHALIDAELPAESAGVFEHLDELREEMPG